MLFEDFGSWEKIHVELATPQVTTNAADIKEVLIVSLLLQVIEKRGFTGIEDSVKLITNC